jgi:membrane-associated protein
MDASRLRRWFVGLALLALVVGAGIWVGPDRIGQFVDALRDLKGLIAWGGYTVLAAIVFAETGLLVGFFLPGDSLLVTAGVFAEMGVLDVVWLHVILVPAAVVGDAVNYAIGRRVGPSVFRREDGRLFKKAHLERTQRFYERHGGKTVILARFLPIVRTFAPFAAGMGNMRYRRFFAFNVIGAVLWVSSMTLTGYWLAKAIPDVDRQLHIVIPVVIAVSFVPGIVEVLRERRRVRREGAAPP